MVQGLEQLATLSAGCFLRAFRHCFLVYPNSSTLADLRRHYNRVFSSNKTDFRNLPFRYTMVAARVSVDQLYRRREAREWWKDGIPSTEDHIQLAGCIAAAAQVGYRRTRGEKVPRWTLHFAHDSLSLDPPSPLSVVAGCLKIIAIDLGCDVSTIGSADERCVKF
jgi:hypothetical protein